MRNIKWHDQIHIDFSSESTNKEKMLNELIQDLSNASQEEQIKEIPTMRKFKKLAFIVPLIAILIASSVTVYASGIWKNFSFFDEKNYHTVFTSESVANNDMKETVKLIEEASENIVLPEQNEANTLEEHYFKTIEEAEKEMDIIIPIPKNSNGFVLKQISGNEFIDKDISQKNVSLLFDDPKNPSMTISIEKTMLFSTGISIKHSSPADAGSQKAYTTPSNVEYVIFSETIPNTSEKKYIASLQVKEYTYTVKLMNGSEDDLKAILDTIDVSKLQ